jgi:Protein of unknown function (DUF1778)
MPTGTKNVKSVMTTIRIPHDQYELLKAAAAAENRSMANFLVTAGLTRVDLIKWATGSSNPGAPIVLSPETQAAMAENKVRSVQKQPR